MKTSPRFWQDEDGVWWCPSGPGGFGRTRCKIKICEQCREEYAVSPHVAAQSRYCTRKCSGLARQGKSIHAIKGENSRWWKGGKTKRRGYVMVYMPEHHSIAGRGTTRKYVLEHRLVMEQELGRPLLQDEHVHHINGIKDDNRPENLELWTTKHSTPGVRADGHKHCPTCTCSSM